MSDDNFLPLSKLAVWSLIFPIIASLAFVHPAPAIFAVLGIALALLALNSIRKYELAGRHLAMLGLFLSAITLLIPLWQVVQFQRESIPGYERIDYSTLTRNESSNLSQFVNRQICLKGYAVSLQEGSLPKLYRSREYKNLTEFQFSADGTSSKSAVKVVLPPGQHWDRSNRSLALSGKLVKNPDAGTAKDEPDFVLVLRSLKPAKTRFQLAEYNGSRGC